MAFGEVGTSLSKIKANSLNLAGTFGFTGTVSGLADETPLVLISTFTSDGSADTATFTSGIDSTYKEYLFVFNNLHPQTDVVEFQFQADTGTNTNFNQTITSTVFRAYHNEAGSATGLAIYSARSQGQGTQFQNITDDIGSGNDECFSGYLKLYNPSSTTFVKHFTAAASNYNSNDHISNWYTAGYFNTTSALTRVRFKFESGEIQGGTIDLFGVV